FVAAVAEGREPDGELAALAKLRSTHNNYLTLPVLFCMISNHYPALYGHPYGWQLLIAISAVLAWTRHFFNLRNQGIVRPSIPISAAVVLILIFVAAGIAARPASAPASNPASGTASAPTTEAGLDDGAAMALVAHHCAVCHATAPTQPGFVAPPGGHEFETLEQVRTKATLMSTSVASGYMPLGNLTGLEPAEREALTTWLGSLQP
ncbi:MAG TPA: urate hydroxylase PuuD, partial [Pseudomonadales bacterium]|nr:urate hydroxylase PuuD [Pseudomonadales bacterium]